MESYCSDTKVTYHKPLTENYNYVHKSCLFGNKWNGGNRSVYGLEDNQIINRLVAFLRSVLVYRFP